MKTFMPTYSSWDELAAIQLKGLQWTVNHAYHGSAVYRDKLDAAGVTAGRHTKPGRPEPAAVHHIERSGRRLSLPAPERSHERGGARARVLRHHRQAQGPLLHAEGCG